MKRTPLKKKPYTWKRFPLKKKESTRTSKGLFKDYKSEKKGLFEKKKSKIQEWNEIREELRERFTKAGITSCELGYIDCTRSANFSFGWTFAHSLKRHEITAAKVDPEQRAKELREVIYACIPCHFEIEKLGNKERFDGKPKMCDIVRAAIRARKRQP